MTSMRVLPGGRPLRNQLLMALPDAVYRRICDDIRMIDVAVGEVLHEHGAAVRRVHFPNGGVYSVTNQMADGQLVEVATVGIEGMLGVGVLLGDPLSAGEVLLQVPDGPLPTMDVAAFQQHVREPGPFRTVAGLYTQAHLRQVMQCTACNALHRVEQRCSRWLLQTHDRVEGDEFMLKQEFLAVMLGVTRPTVTVVMGTLQQAGLISTHYGRIRILDRQGLERAACECYAAIVANFARLTPATSGV